MLSSKDLVKRAIEFRNPERVPHNFDSNRTPVIAERYRDDFFEWAFSRAVGDTFAFRHDSRGTPEWQVL